MNGRRTQDQRGFTLVEVLVSMSIIAGMLTLVWGSFSIGSRGKRKAEAIADRYYQLRLAVNRMAREISMAYLSKNDQIGAVWPRTFFVSERNSTVDTLMFSYLGHQRLDESAKESDQAIVRYYAEADPADSSRVHLMRRETARLGAERPDEAGAAYRMLEDIEKLHFEFFDEPANEWRETWSTRSADGQPDRLPAKIRILITIKDERGRSLTVQTATRTHLRDPLWFTVASQ